MPIWDLLKPVPGWSAAEAKAFMQDRKPWEYVVLDVREPVEYRDGHVPGAIHIPVGILPNCLEGIDKEMPTIVVCAVGGRSTSAVGMLLKAGCKQVFNLNGGMKAWRGMRTRPMKGMTSAIVGGSPNLEQTVALAWIVEDATREFYKILGAQVAEEYAKWAFKEIEDDEAHHQRTLEELYRTIFFRTPPSGFPYSLLSEWKGTTVEGGQDLNVLVSRLAGKPVTDAVETAIAAETNALDMHLLMDRKAGDKEARRVFRALAGMELKHIDKLTKLLGEGGQPRKS